MAQLESKTQGRDIASGSRDVFMDNAKGMLIVLVVLGHSMESVFGIESAGSPEVLRSMIYCFHMPLFIFISGYYAKNVRKVAASAIATCLVPYILFDYAWAAMTSQSAFVDLLTPVYAFWFLLSLFFWRVLIGPLSKVKHIFAISIAAGLLVGCLDSADRFLSASRTIAFLPFFILGYQFNKETVAKIRSKSPWVGVSVFAVVMVTVALMDAFGLVPVRAYENIQCYVATGMGLGYGLAVRGIEYVAGFIAVFALLSCIPDRQCVVSNLGQRSLSIYLLSSFVMSACFKVLKVVGVFDILQGVEIVGIVASLVVAVVVVAATGNNMVSGAFSKVLKLLGDAISVKESVSEQNEC